MTYEKIRREEFVNAPTSKMHRFHSKQESASLCVNVQLIHVNEKCKTARNHFLIVANRDLISIDNVPRTPPVLSSFYSYISTLSPKIAPALKKVEQVNWSIW